jgi:putative protein-disulfide isomerase
MKLVYCYDAYCGWCYGFSAVMKEVAKAVQDRLAIEVLSAGMIISENPPHISATAEYIRGAYPRVEQLSGVQFGADYLWHINNPDKTDWFPNSEKPAIALCIFKEIHEDHQVEFAADLQYALHFEGRDLTDDEAYRHLLEKYTIDVKDFFAKLRSAEYKEKAHYEFALVKQLQVTGFPCLLLQVSELKFYLIARGYTDYNKVMSTIEAVLKDVSKTPGAPK